MDYYFDSIQERRKKTACQTPFVTEAVFSDETENFRSPAEPSSEDFVWIFFQTAKNNATAVYLCMDERKLLMEKFQTKESLDDYRVLLPPTTEKKQYYFEIVHNDEIYYYTRYGVMQEFPTNGFFYVVRNFHTPSWAKGAIMYQIYVDRFCNGDLTNDVKTGEYSYLDHLVEGETKWDSQPKDSDFRCFYGGDLQGILNKLDYLEELGVEVLYLNPIFVSPSSHKYDIQDYDHIDPHYGKIVVDDETVLHEGERNLLAAGYITRTTNEQNLQASDALFAELTAQVHKRGMRILLDGVFNHCGSFHRWLDKEKIYAAEGKGVYDTQNSPYQNYFYWNEDGSYEGWWGHENHPKLNVEGCPSLYQEIMRIGQKWVSAPYSADGWRLDVAADVGKTEQFNHTFWHDFRKAVKQANPEALILAEHYGDANRWLEGDQWDGVMNYDAFMEPVGWFFTGMSKHSTEYRADLHNNAQVFWATMCHQSGRIPAQAMSVAMNELSNHDHSRFLTRTNGKIGRLHTDGACAADTGIRKAVFREAVLLQMTWSGAPTIYYGDEAGVTGWTDPDNRRTFPWGREDADLIAYHKALIHLRKEHVQLRSGSVKPLLIAHGILAYARFDAQGRYIVVCNNQEKSVSLQIPVWHIGTKRFGKMRVLLHTTQQSYDVQPVEHEMVDGILALELSAQSGILMKEV